MEEKPTEQKDMGLRFNYFVFSPPTERFWVYSGQCYERGCGMEQFSGSFPTLEEAVSAGREYIAGAPGSYWASLLDSETGEWFDFGEVFPKALGVGSSTKADITWEGLFKAHSMDGAVSEWVRAEQGFADDFDRPCILRPDLVRKFTMCRLVFDRLPDASPGPIYAAIKKLEKAGYKVVDQKGATDPGKWFEVTDKDHGLVGHWEEGDPPPRFDANGLVAFAETMEEARKP